MTMAYTFLACTVSINALCKQLIDASALRFQHLLSLGNTLRYQFDDVSNVTFAHYVAPDRYAAVQPGPYGRH